MNINELENYYLHLIEEKQIELIWHPTQREQCGIHFTIGGLYHTLYSYPEDTPMSIFKELNMFRIFLTHLQSEGLSHGDWKTYALKAVSYLRLLPPDVQEGELNVYHNFVANAYEKEGNINKANSHRRQAFSYQTDRESIAIADMETLLQSMKNTPDTQLDLCLYILFFIVESGIWATDDYYHYWTRYHYLLIETILKQDLIKFVTDDKQAPYVTLLVNSLKGIYFKRTRRFILAEKHLLEALCTQVVLGGADKEFPISPLMIYLQLVEVYLHMGSMEKAQLYLDKAVESSSWDAKLLEPLINSLSGTPLEEEQWNNINDQYVYLFMNLCKENATFNSSIKAVIENFFASPEIIDNDNEEEGDDEVEYEQEYTFDEWYECAESGNVEAQLIIGYCYYTGDAVSQNYRLAHEWFYIAALQEDAIAQHNLGYMYEKGYGTEVNPKEAEKWHQKAKSGKSIWRADLIHLLFE